MIRMTLWSYTTLTDVAEKSWGDCDTHLYRGTRSGTSMTNGVGDEFGDQQR